MCEIKIATFNINNVNKRLANLLKRLRRARPDVACLQELKATDSQIPVAALEIWRGQKWNGVGILARNYEPVVTRTKLPGDPDDAQSLYIEAAVFSPGWRVCAGCMIPHTADATAMLLRVLRLKAALTRPWELWLSSRFLPSS